MPFRHDATHFTLEQLNALTTAFDDVRQELNGLDVEASDGEIANCLLDQAGKGVFDVEGLKRAALEAFKC